MPRKRYTPEQIINSLREAEVLLSQGNTTRLKLQDTWALQNRPITAGEKNTAV